MKLPVLFEIIVLFLFSKYILNVIGYHGYSHFYNTLCFQLNKMFRALQYLKFERKLAKTNYVL